MSKLGLTRPGSGSKALGSGSRKILGSQKKIVIIKFICFLRSVFLSWLLLGVRAYLNAYYFCCNGCQRLGLKTPGFFKKNVCLSTIFVDTQSSTCHPHANFRWRIVYQHTFSIKSSNKETVELSGFIIRTAAVSFEVNWKRESIK